jgi:hypothetical protein
VKGLLKRVGRALLGVLTDLLIEGRKAGKWSTDSTSAARPAPPSDRTMDQR